jgi:hypothetical protein
MQPSSAGPVYSRGRHAMTRPLVGPAALICLIALSPRSFAGPASSSSAPAPAGTRAEKKAPPPRCVIAPVDLAIVPRISLNARRRPCARNYLGLALVYGRADELRGVQLALGANAVERSMVGAQFAFGVNAAGGNATGLQHALLVNAAGASFAGFQLAGLINAAGQDLRGVQFSGLINAAGRDATAFQLSGLGNAAGGQATGLQASFGFNAAGGGMRGLQLAGLFNGAGSDSRAVQIAGLFNAIGGRASGVQLAGLFNAAGRLHGLQLAAGMNATGHGEGLQLAAGYNRAEVALTGVQIAAVNVGRDVSGAQIGLVNVARRVRGVQLGLVNVADDVDAPIGAVSWVGRGESAFEMWGGEALALAAAARLGTHRFYSLGGISTGPLVDGMPWGPVGGAGVKGAIGRAGLLFDALAHALFFDGFADQALLAQARARLAFAMTPRLALTVGATWNVFVSGDVDGAGLPLGGDTVNRSGDTTVRQWPGFTAGAVLGL